MTGLSRFGLGFAAFVLATLATPAAAQPDPDSDGPRHLVRASVLIYPVFDIRPGFNTLVTVTNTNTDRRVHDNGFRTGDVTVHFVYVDGESWAESDLPEDLTPGDTITVRVTDHQTDNLRGWLWVEARDPEFPDRPIDFDFLIGSAILTNMDFNLDWEYAPYSFRSLICENGERKDEHKYTGESGNGHCYVEDPEEPDGFLNFDGIEYDFFPDELYVDQFFGEGMPADKLPGATFANTIYILSTEMVGTVLNLLFYNNNERFTSRANQRFDCWTGRPLSGFGTIANHDQIRGNYNPNELRGIPYGWVLIRSNDPILACFVQRITRGAFTFIAGDAVHFAGTQEASIERFF